MSNPCDITGDPFVDLTVPMFWLPAKTYPEDVSEDPQSSTAKNNEALESFHLQAWNEKARVLELSQNIRSGDDKWFSDVLDQCRLGQLSEQNYNFLHGLPANDDITFWYAKKEDPYFPDQHKETSCSIAARCQDCVTEIGRRNRLLRADTNPTEVAQKLADPRWLNCVFITPSTRFTSSSSSSSSSSSCFGRTFKI